MHIKHTSYYANRLYNNHPHKYNLYGLSKMLELYNIPNLALKITDLDLNTINTPFIAHIESNFIIVEQIIDDNVSFILDGNKVAMNKQQFIKLWSGIALLATPTDFSIEPRYYYNLIKTICFNTQKALLIVLPLIFLYKNLFIIKGDTTKIGLLITNLIGGLLSYLLLQKQIYSKQVYADKICSLFTKKDCNNILDSKNGKLFDWISWSEIGLGYFISNVLIIIFIPRSLSTLSLINILVLPFTLWSIWIQFKVVKQWCLLCILVQCILWVSFIVSFCISPFETITISSMQLCYFGLIYIFSILLINKLSFIIQEKERTGNINQELNRIKYTEEVFKVLLKQQPYYKVELSDSCIILGNPKAHLRITVLTNPHCEPCARMHLRIENLLNRCGDKISVQYIFTSFNDELVESSRFLIAVFKKYRMAKTAKIYSEWFRNEKYNAKSYIAKEKFNLYENIIEKELTHHTKWTKSNNIYETPTVLINGYKLPEQYKIEDIIEFTNLVLT